VIAGFGDKLKIWRDNVTTEIRIGKVVLKNNLVLAPMAGITDIAMRRLAKEGGAGLVYTEMASAKALTYCDGKTKRLLKMSDTERPIAIQIFGGDATTISQAAKIAEDMGADIVDINLGCPVRKIAKAGAGAKLLANEKLIAEILEAAVKSVKIPVTIKTRLGLVEGQNVAGEIIEIAQKSGIAMAAVHARYACNGHSGEPCVEDFREACQDAKIPVFANGGIVDEISAKKFLDIPNCSGLMIGRGAIANYSIFNELLGFFNENKMPQKPSLAQKTQWLKTHAQYSMAHYPHGKGLIIMRKVFSYYVKGFPNASTLRDRFNKISTPSEFDKLLQDMQS
jgi:tRNA-dihydrouridine synthase B